MINDQMPFATVGGSTARFSDCGTYRYELARRWSHGPAVAWIMLNPSTADASVDDPTIRRCIQFSRGWGMGGLVVVNLFALRSTDPAALKTAAWPVGPENDDAIHDAIVRSRAVVAAWGVHGDLRGRADEVREMVAVLGRPLSCLGTTKDGHPRHPLYVKGDTPLMTLEERKGAAA